MTVRLEIVIPKQSSWGVSVANFAGSPICLFPNISIIHVSLPKQLRLFLIACRTRQTLLTVVCVVLALPLLYYRIAFARGAGGPEIDENTNEAGLPRGGD
jgi:hypothetical protein